MRFLKTRAIYILIGIVAIMTVFTVAVSISISITMIEKKNQLADARAYAAKPIPAAAGASVSVNIRKAMKFPVYFNGTVCDAFDYYFIKDKQALLPADVLLKQLGIDYKLFNSDDVFQTVIDRKRFSVKLGTAEASFGGNSMVLRAESMAADNHILVSDEVLSMFSDFSFNFRSKENGTFINYWPSSFRKDFQKAYLFSLSSGTPEVKGLFDAPAVKWGEKVPGKLDVAIYCPDVSAYILKAGGETWLLSSKDIKNPRRLDIPSEYEISTGGRYLYWFDASKEHLYVYDIKNNSRKELKNYFSLAEKSRGISNSEFRLIDFQVAKRYTRVDFQENGGAGVFTILERRGKLAAVGESSYSPDKGRILFCGIAKQSAKSQAGLDAPETFNKSSNGCFVIDSDGTDMIDLGKAAEADWVDNDRIFLNSDNGMNIFYRGKREMVSVDTAERYAGQALNGDVFFQKDNAVFVSSRNKIDELFKIPWKCDYLYAASSKGPFCVVSVNEDSVLGILGDSAISLGRPGLFINKQVQTSAKAAYEGNIAFSPDSKRIAVLQKGNVFLEVNIAAFADMKVDKLVLDYPVADAENNSAIRIKWLNGSSVLIRNEKQGWLLSMKGKTYIYKWVNNENQCTIGDLSID